MKIEEKNHSTKLAFVMMIYYLGIMPILMLIDRVGISVYKNISLTILIFIIMYVFLFIREKRYNYIDIGLNMSLLVLGIMVYKILISYVNTLPYETMLDANQTPIRKYHIYFLGSTIVPCIFMLIVGLELQNIIIYIKQSKKIYIRLLYYIVTILIVVIKILYYPQGGVALLNEQGRHLFLGDTYSILSLIVIFIYVKKNIKYQIISCITLYLIGSRSSLFIFVFTLIMMYILAVYNKKRIGKKENLLFILIAIAVLSGIIFLTNSKFSEEIINNNRILNLIVNSEDDHSLGSRNELMDVGIQYIRQNPIKGNLFYEIDHYKLTGRYIHNMMSYWAEYGLICFILIIIIICIKFIRLKNDRGLVKALLIFNMISIIFSRSYTYTFIWIIFGMKTNIKRRIEK